MALNARTLTSKERSDTPRPSSYGARQSGWQHRSLYSTDVVRSTASSARRIKSIPVHKTEIGNRIVISLTCTNGSLKFYQ